jgi:hypothetical protein
MNGEPIDPHHISSAWLTEVLRDQGLLRIGGRVTSFQIVNARPSKVATCLIVRVWYDDPSIDLPTRFFLKITHPEFQHGMCEVEFYQAASEISTAAPSPFVRCYAAWTNAFGQACLLLDDLSQSHFTPAKTVMPSEQHTQQAVRTLAQAHAFWWERIPLTPRTSTDLLDNVGEGRLKSMHAYAEFMGSEVPTARYKTYERILTTWPLPNRRKRALTLIHRDAHPWNFLYAFDPSQQGYLIDWQSWRIGTATNDLAYLLAAFWEPKERREIEQSMMRLYYDTLVASGVSNYTWDEFWDDYRASIIRSAVMLVGGWNANRGKDRRIQRVMSAFDDWECENLLATS